MGVVAVVRVQWLESFENGSLADDENTSHYIFTQDQPITGAAAPTARHSCTPLYF